MASSHDDTSPSSAVAGASSDPAGTLDKPVSSPPPLSSGPRQGAPRADVVVTTRERPERGRGEVELTRETARWRVARNLMALLGLTILLLGALLASSKWTGLAPEDTVSALNAVITALVTLVGSAVGFYFGTEKGSAGAPQGSVDD